MVDSVAMGVRLVDLNAASFDRLPCCGIKNAAHPGREAKLRWLKENARLGLRARVLVGPDGRPGGYIEYVPGEFAWRGVDARGYMFIHCIWVHPRRNQGKGWGSVAVRACLEDARRTGLSGAAVMVRKGPWMADRRLFLANGFECVDTAPPDYELLAIRFDGRAAAPAFKKDDGRKLARYGKGLTILHCGQCPYIAKFVGEIAEAAESACGMRPKLVELKSWEDAQRAPTPYAVFAVIHDGRLLADHPISRTRFRNIMRKPG